LPRCLVVHADLYRVQSPAELDEIAFADVARDAIVLVEWPERADFAAADRLDIALSLAPDLGPAGRRAEISGHGTLARRIDRMAAIRTFLEEAGLSEATRTRVQGDASTRSYERLALGERRVILMNAPRRPDGPPLRGGLP